MAEDNPRALPDFVGCGADAVALPARAEPAGAEPVEVGVAGVELVVLTAAAAELTSLELAVAKLAGAEEDDSEATKTSAPNTMRSMGLSSWQLS